MIRAIGAGRPFANGNQRLVCTNGFGIIRRIALGRCSAAFPSDCWLLA